MADVERSDRKARGVLVPPRPVRYDDRGDGWTLAAELVTATFVWGGIGWLGDRLLGTAPVLMALGFVLGNALGVYLIWLRSQDRFEREHADLLAKRARPTRDPATGDTEQAQAAAGPGGGAPAVPRGDLDVADDQPGGRGRTSAPHGEPRDG
jgi:F0F1-type ATP synthase assembly protein I